MVITMIVYADQKLRQIAKGIFGLVDKVNVHVFYGLIYVIYLYKTYE